MAEQLDDRQCPYCGCTFTPVEPGQCYCSAWCEQADGERTK